MVQTRAIVWFRHDLRLADHPALNAAAQSETAILPVFVWSPESEGEWPPGAATRWWLHHSLEALNKTLNKRGSRLLVLKGRPEDVLTSLARRGGAGAIFASRRYDPAGRNQESALEERCDADRIACQWFGGALSIDPAAFLNKQGGPYRVFTPFWKAMQMAPEPGDPLPEPRHLFSPKSWPDSTSVDDLKLPPSLPWDAGFHDHWTPGENGANRRLDQFLNDKCPDYPSLRDRPDLDGVSRLSPHLRWGEISPRQILHRIRLARDKNCDPIFAEASTAFVRQLAWREFSHYLLFHYPFTETEPLHDEFAAFPWETNDAALEAWRSGRTGYPIVDAGMRELWATGWMHNRVRMIAASFLVKDLRIHWLDGARWFWDTLVDADLANNTMGWQWTAGCGADAAPYFRIFNPAAQAKKFDPQSQYIQKWIPELNNVNSHYPAPIIDHGSARRMALTGYETVKAFKRSRQR